MSSSRAAVVGICTRKSSPSSYIRLILPLFQRSLSAKIIPKFLDVNKVNNMQLDEQLQNNNLHIDRIVIQRDYLDFPAAEKIVEEGKKRGIKIIYEIDDDLLSIDENHPQYKKYKEKNAIIRFLSQNADIVTVSTETLAQRFKNCKKVYVIKNALDENLWFSPVAKHPHKETNEIKIGYLGSFTHKGDLELLKEPILRLNEKLKKKYGLKADFHVIGGIRGKFPEENWFRQVPVPKRKSIYPRFVKWLRATVDWDLAVAPLQNNSFNQSKSELKYLEYTALGLPGIYCNVGSYAEVIKHGENGLLAPPDQPDSWVYSLFQLITDKSLQKQIFTNAGNDVQGHYLLQHRVRLLEEIYGLSKEV